MRIFTWLCIFSDILAHIKGKLNNSAVSVKLIFFVVNRDMIIEGEMLVYISCGNYAYEIYNFSLILA